MIRRAIGTTLAGLCALTGPLAGGAFAATTDPALTASVAGARPGVAFTVTPTSSGGGCPSASGVQMVELTFTDHAGTAYAIGSVDTEDDGTWSAATALLPVLGLDADGAWSNTPVSTGAGTLTAACFAADDSGDDSGVDEGSDDGSDDSVGDPGDDDPTDPGDDDTGDPDETSAPTRTYPGLAFTATGTAPKLTLSASVLKPGDTVTVTPAEGCAGTGALTVEVALISLSDAADDGSGEEDGDIGDDDGTDDPTDDPSGLPVVSAITSATGAWSPVSLVVPADAATGDYAVTADCATGDTVTGSYDAQPVAVGTVLISAATCTAKGATVALTGTYSGDIAGKEAGLPTKLALTGDGPWKIKVRAATTEQQLATRTVACAKPQYQLDVSKTGLAASNKPQARVCNTGRAPVSAVLQVLASKKYQKVDKETVDPGECVWLQGPKLDKGEQVKAQVLIDAPGKGSDDVAESFSVKRGKR